MKGPFIYLGLSMMMLSRHHNFPGFVILILMVIAVVSAIMSIFQLIGWVINRLDSPMTAADRNRAARDKQTKPPATSGPTGQPPLP
jgi:hypothetical protein